MTERIELFLMGRAAFQLKTLYPRFPARGFFDEPCRPPFLRDWHNHFDNYENIMPGYCGGIALGTWRDIDHLINEGIDLAERPILNFLISEDMQGLFHFAMEYGYAESPDGYVSRCHLCLDIRKYLISKKDFHELIPKEFYAHLV